MPIQYERMLKIFYFHIFEYHQIRDHSKKLFSRIPRNSWYSKLKKKKTLCELRLGNLLISHNFFYFNKNNWETFVFKKKTVNLTNFSNFANFWGKIHQIVDIKKLEKEKEKNKPWL